MLLRSGTDFCYNLHGGFLVETGNGIDNRQLLLEWGTKKAHILEDTVNIFLGRIQLVEQPSEQAALCDRKVAADCR